MCISCGCGKVHDDHGDSRHLTLEDLKHAADAAGVSVEQVVQNIQSSAYRTRPHPSSSRPEPEGPESI
jgi:hypothetical protein